MSDWLIFSNFITSSNEHSATQCEVSLKSHGFSVFLFSIAGHHVGTLPSSHFYCGTKHMVTALTQGLRKSAQSKNIRVTVIIFMRWMPARRYFIVVNLSVRKFVIHCDFFPVHVIELESWSSLNGIPGSCHGQSGMGGAAVRPDQMPWAKGYRRCHCVCAVGATACERWWAADHSTSATFYLMSDYFCYLFFVSYSLPFVHVQA